MPVKPNELVAGYLFAQKIGEGGTGTVWVAREKDTSVLVSIKLLKAEVFPPSTVQAAYERLVGAVTNAGRLTHQNLAQVRTTFHQPRLGLYGIVTEYLEGQSLEHIQIPRVDGRPGASDPRTMAGVLSWFQQLAAALAWLHTNGLVHGNLKPSNVLLQTGFERPHLKLLDLCWSLAEIPAMYPDQKFRAPEIPANAANTTAGDQWSAAKLLQHVLVSSDSGVPAHKALAAAPVSLLKVVQRALQPDPRQRFPDLGAFFYAIESVKNELEASFGGFVDTRAAATAQLEAVSLSRPRSGIGDPSVPTEPVNMMPRKSRGPTPGASFATDDLSGGNYVDIIPRPSGGAPAAVASTKRNDPHAPLIGVDPSRTEEAAEVYREDTGAQAQRRGSMMAIGAISLVIAALVAVGAYYLFGRERETLPAPEKKPPAAVAQAQVDRAALERAEAEAKRVAMENAAKQAAADDEAKTREAAAAVKAATETKQPPPPPPPPKKDERAIADKACAQGNATACLEVAELYLADDELRAAAAYEKACEAGRLNGCMKAGELYEKHNGTKARRTYERACDRRIAQACELLARLFETGVGGARNARAAAAFKDRACRLGLRSACR